MRRVGDLVLRLGLGGLFIVAGLLKLPDPAGFATSISHYQILPQLSGYLAVVLPPVEIVAGVALIALPVAWRRAGALIIAGMMALFTAAAGLALARGIDVQCGCFGSASDAITGVTVARDLLLLAGAVWLVVSPRRGPRAA